MGNTGNKYNSTEYKRARVMYVGYCTFEYFISILAADVFLAKLLTHMGVSDGVIGIISSFITLAFLFQLFAIFIAQRIRNTKSTVIIFEGISQIFFALLYLIPFINASPQMRAVIVSACIFGAYITKYLVSNILFKWANSYVEPYNRGIYSAVKEMISLISGIVFTLMIGHVVDSYEAAGKMENGFIFLSVTIFALAVVNTVCLLLIKGEKKAPAAFGRNSFSDVLANVLLNKKFTYVIIMTVLYDVARYLTTGFLGVYKTKDLLLTVGAVQVINMVANLIRFFMSKPFGRFSDKYSFAKGMELAFLLVALAFFANIFTTPKTWWIIVIYTILFNVSQAGTVANTFNITYSYVESQYIVEAMAIKNSIGGIFGFGAAMLGSKILEMVQVNGNMVFGIPMYGQQLLSAISFVIMVITVLFVKFVIEKQEVIIQ